MRKTAAKALRIVKILRGMVEACKEDRGNRPTDLVSRRGDWCAYARNPESQPSECQPRSPLCEFSLKLEHGAVRVRVISGCDGYERSGCKRTELAEEILRILLGPC